MGWTKGMVQRAFYDQKGAFFGRLRILLEQLPLSWSV